MEILPVKPEILEYAQKRRLTKKFVKQTKLLELNIRHPSLNVELLAPKSMRIYSFRVDKKYRAIFIFKRPSEIEILKVTDHYK